MSTTGDYKSDQYEFTDEQARNVGALAHAMAAVALMLKLLGLAFVVFAGLQLAVAISTKEHYAAPLGLSAAALLFLVVGFWTSSSARSFEKIVATRNEDMWHLMNALRSLYNMYSLMRTIIIGGLVLAVVGVAIVVFTMIKGE